MINLPGVTFAEQRVTPAADATFQSAALTDGRLKGCSMSFSAYTLTIQPGYLLVAGRIIEVDTVKSIAVDGAVSGYARILLTVDLTQSSSKTSFRQVQLDVEYASSPAGFASLRQEDINGGTGSVYQFVLASMALSASGMTSVDPAPYSGSAATRAVTVRLAANAWANNAQQVSVDGVSADSSLTHVIVTPDPSNDAAWAAWSTADVRCKQQLNNALVFVATTTPTVDLYANVLIL